MWTGKLSSWLDGRLGRLFALRWIDGKRAGETQGGAGAEGCEVSDGKKSSNKLQRRWRRGEELGWGGQTEDAGEKMLGR